MLQPDLVADPPTEIARSRRGSSHQGQQRWCKSSANPSCDALQICSTGRVGWRSWPTPASRAGSESDPLQNAELRDSAGTDPYPSPSERSGPDLPITPFSSVRKDLERSSVSGLPDDRLRVPLRLV